MDSTTLKSVIDNHVTTEISHFKWKGLRLPYKPYRSDVARMLLWLASDDSRACTAQRWIVDGGRM